MSDYIIRATGANHQVRIFAATTKELVETARAYHQTSPVATAALGRLLTAGAMMGTMLKGDKDKLTLKIKCDGPIGGLTVTADAKAMVKGYADNPQVMLPPNKAGKLDVGGALLGGILSVIKDMGLKEPYAGQIHLVSGEIAEDLTYYFTTSEQINSSVALGVLIEKNKTVKQAGGFIVQVMPFAGEEVIAKVEDNIKDIYSITALLEVGYTPEDIVNKVLDGLEIQFLDRIPTQFYCDCSKEKVKKVLISMGKKELQAMIDDEEPVEVHCHFCNKDYDFQTNEIKELLKIL